MNSFQRHLRVTILTPLGEGGAGGIDRLMDFVRDELRARPRENIEIKFATTRGRYKWLWPARFLASLVRLGLGNIVGQSDVVHINVSSYGSTARKIAFALACEAARVPYIVHLHGSEFAQFWKAQHGLRKLLVNRLFADAAAILVLGQHWADLVRRELPDIEHKLSILPNATPRAERLAGESTEPLIIFLGRVGPRKGVPQLLTALSDIADDQDWRAVIAGDGEIAETRHKVQELGLGERVEVPGWVDGEAVKELLNKADILVLPSFDENLPMSIIEGMAHGLAVVCTPVGAVRDIVEDERTALLVAPGDAKALAHAVQRLLDDPDLRARLGTNARVEHSNRLEISNYVDRLVEIWREAAATSAPHL